MVYFNLNRCFLEGDLCMELVRYEQKGNLAFVTLIVRGQ